MKHIVGKIFNHYKRTGKDSVEKRYKEGDEIDFGNGRVYIYRKDGALIRINHKLKPKGENQNGNRSNHS